ncbi:hypothetical protein C8R32_11621 [Nitrosospira sp. Nsp5]|uniref:Uncharacterized protein n=1 Tax=Nitrosospira multiformis TaxID=1231 RepID=A0ABY0TCL2_9PROT|nr:MULTISPECIES: hypothetical protein [Nitrosospira]PTR05775.1 hypothetical protein C8R32_11621 [Nitrosospira sp. Nsp5]SDQ62646.1 hypothetical protein SAMN05216402_1604 [Nitrosospira multiformis]
MHITAVTTEKNLDELLRKLNINLNPAELVRIRDATLEINPHLRTEGNFKPGTVIMLPNLEQLDLNALTNQNDVNTSSNSIELIINGIKTHGRLLIDELRLNSKKIDKSAKLLRSLKKQSRSTESTEAAVLAEKFESTLEAERAANEEALNSLPREIAVLQSDLSVLLKNLD